MILLQDRRRKSVKMSKDEHKAFLKFVESMPTKLDACYAIGISRPTLDSLIFKGSGRPETIELVRNTLTAAIRA